MNGGLPLPEAPWPLLVGAYLVLIGAASGITLVAWGLRPRERVAALHFEWVAAWAALAAIAVAGLILVVDLGRPSRFYLMVTEFSNLGSAMSVGAKLLALKGLLLLAYLYLLHRWRRAAREGALELAPGATRWTYGGVLVALGLVSFGLAVYPGALLSRTWLAPLAASPGSGALFLMTALLMGAAFAVVAAMLTPVAADEEFLARARNLLLVLVGMQAVLLVFAALGLPGGPPGVERALAQLFGSGVLLAAFWGLVVAAGIGLPPLLLWLAPRYRLTYVSAATAAVLGAGATRYLMFALR